MSVQPVFIADANLLLRFLIEDHEEHTAAVREVIAAAIEGQCILRVPEVVVMDVYYTLTAKRIGMPRALAADRITALIQLPGIRMDRPLEVFKTLVFCGQYNIDYCDAALAVESQKDGHAVLSFDKDFNKIPELEAMSPTQWLAKRKKK